MTLTPSTRASLLLRLRDSQDHQAWVEFVALYEPAAYRLLRRHGLQDADARDVLQDLLLAVSRSIDRWDPAKERGSFRGWLRRVARNLLVNWLKQRQRRLLAPAVRTGRRCSTGYPLAGRPMIRDRRRSNSTRSCVARCFSARPNKCGAKSRQRPGRPSGRPASRELRPPMPPESWE